MRRLRGFTLTEMAVVLALVGLLLGSLMYTLSAQSDQRNFDDTRQRLEQARELLLAYAMTNGRLPCPARSAATAFPATVAGDEVNNGGNCVGDAVTDYYGGSSGGVTLGLLPARTLGVQQVDSDGFAIDAWGNRLRYAVANLVDGGTCVTGPPHFTNATTLKANGVSCLPNDLIVCKSATGISGTGCGGAANQIMAASVVAAIIFSTGKNGGTVSGGAGADEAANLNGDRVFVWHTPTGSEAANGAFDDQMLWITYSELYGKMVASGVLP